ncbi:hypothetical protein [Streptomyces sp. NPDC059894]|uniref:hypothetical protein n=1 Tax=unclassified Streptomyces TaxID=2593676 RepID=UPI003664A36E
MRSTAGSTTPTGTATRPEPADRVRRFTTAERWVHRTTGHLMLVSLVSAACLYLGPLARLVGRRHLMVGLHEWSGISLPLPFLLGLFSPVFRYVSRSWARRHHARWLGEERPEAGSDRATEL